MPDKDETGANKGELKTSRLFIAGTALIALVAGLGVGWGFFAPKAVGPIHAMITLNPDNSCTQGFNTYGGPVTDAIPHSLSLSGGGTVDWNNTSFYPGAPPTTVTFATYGANGPFRTGSFANGASTGTPTGPNPGDFYFGSVIINDPVKGPTACTNVDAKGTGPKPLGVHIDR